jgi:hypothetical protein
MAKKTCSGGGPLWIGVLLKFELRERILMAVAYHSASRKKNKKQMTVAYHSASREETEMIAVAYAATEIIAVAYHSVGRGCGSACGESQHLSRFRV